MALGARVGDVVGLIIGGGLRPTLIGIAIGGVGAALGARALGTLLYEVPPADPLTFAAVAGLFVLVALAARYVPAHRAARVDPLIALRSE